MNYIVIVIVFLNLKDQILIEVARYIWQLFEIHKSRVRLILVAICLDQVYGIIYTMK
jgi:hypothetical protein